MLIDDYNAAIQQGDIEENHAQKEAMAHLQRIVNDCLVASKRWYWFKPRVKGVYLYGSVGVGKTYLMDLFYQHIDEPCKARFHFHHFMQQIDTQLRTLQGTKDPLRQIAKNLAKTTRILCLDEFLVEDVAIAMILAELLQALLKHGIILVITSNTSPDFLYLNGPQRARFLPAIALLKQSCELVELQLEKDYRLNRLPGLQTYLYPLNRKTAQTLQAQYQQIVQRLSLVHPHHETVASSDISKTLDIQKRDVVCIDWQGTTVWFDFNVICHIPRSQLDYLEIANRFETLFITNIPQLGPNDTTQVVLFIRLVDVMYDQGIHLVLSAAVPLDALYVEGPMLTTFQRTLSRLHEMQAADYWRRHPYHLTSK